MEYNEFVQLTEQVIINKPIPFQPLYGSNTVRWNSAPNEQFGAKWSLNTS